MKVFKNYLVKKEKTINIYCNKCGAEITKIGSSNFADFLEIKKYWGYFSEKDGEIHSFDICEDCYNQFINSFKIPVEKSGQY